MRDEKVKVLNAIRRCSRRDPPQDGARPVRRGVRRRAEAPAYRAEPSVARTSATETFGALKLDVDNWRWAGVPFYLRSGSRQTRHRDRDSSEASASASEDPDPDLEPNRLILSIQPEEGITIEIKAKRPARP